MFIDGLYIDHVVNDLFHSSAGRHRLANPIWKFADIGLRTVGMLIVQRMALQKLVQGDLAAIERFDGIGHLEFANRFHPGHESVQYAGCKMRA